VDAYGRYFRACLLTCDELKARVGSCQFEHVECEILAGGDQIGRVVGVTEAGYGRSVHLTAEAGVEVGL